MNYFITIFLIRFLFFKSIPRVAFNSPCILNRTSTTNYPSLCLIEHINGVPDNLFFEKNRLPLPLSKPSKPWLSLLAGSTSIGFWQDFFAVLKHNFNPYFFTSYINKDITLKPTFRFRKEAAKYKGKFLSLLVTAREVLSFF